MFKLTNSYGNVVCIANTEKKKNELLKRGYKLVEDKKPSEKKKAVADKKPSEKKNAVGNNREN